MEKETLNQTLQYLLDQFIELYRAELTKNDAISTGKLYNSLKSQIIDDSGYIILQDYWKFLEYGRSPGKLPNITAITNWIKQKPVNSYNGKLPTTEQLAYMISKSIADKGIQSKPMLSNALQALDVNLLEDAVTKDISNTLDKQLNQI